VTVPNLLAATLLATTVLTATAAADAHVCMVEPGPGQMPIERLDLSHLTPGGAALMLAVPHANNPIPARVR